MPATEACREGNLVISQMIKQFRPVNVASPAIQCTWSDTRNVQSTAFRLTISPPTNVVIAACPKKMFFSQPRIMERFSTDSVASFLKISCQSQPGMKHEASCVTFVQDSARWLLMCWIEAILVIAVSAVAHLSQYGRPHTIHALRPRMESTIQLLDMPAFQAHDTFVFDNFRRWDLIVHDQV